MLERQEHDPASPEKNSKNTYLQSCRKVMLAAVMALFSAPEMQSSQTAQAADFKNITQIVLELEQDKAAYAEHIAAMQSLQSEIRTHEKSLGKLGAKILKGTATPEEREKYRSLKNIISAKTEVLRSEKEEWYRKMYAKYFGLEKNEEGELVEND